MVRLENRGAPHRSRALDHPRSSRCGPTYCGVPEKSFEILLGFKKSSLFIILVSPFFFQTAGPQNALPSFSVFRLALNISKSSFLFFLWAEAETRKSEYLKSGLGRDFWSKIGPQNSTHVFFFFFRLGLAGKWDAHVGVRKNPALFHSQKQRIGKYKETKQTVEIRVSH